jgi:NAD(P)-dependent dehydrogenase (short-subunit alcohol dehydrogenase family)
MATQQRTVFITGAAGGLGGRTAQTFARRGWLVYAADLRPGTASPGIVPIELDVTDPQAVAAVAEHVGRECPDGLGAVVNFAGIMLVAPLIEMPEADLRRIIDINVLGTFRVNKALFPLVRAGGGRLVNISSETGWQRALMLNGAYAMTKHAVSAYSDALRRELMFLDVPVVTIEPGPFRTDMVGGIGSAFARAGESTQLFSGLIRKVGKMAAAEESKAHDPQLLADVVWQAATTPRPRPIYSVKPDLQRSVLSRMPVRLADAAIKKMLT